MSLRSDSTVAQKVNLTDECGLIFSSGGPLKLGGGFEGVPSVLIFYALLVWPALMILFLLTRKVALKKLSGTVHNNIINACNLFSRPPERRSITIDLPDSPEQQELESLTSQASEIIYDEEQFQARNEQLAQLDRERVVDGGFFGFLKDSFRFIWFDDEVMMNLAGDDGVQYLRFQKHLIVIVIMTTIMSLIIIPINMSGELLEESPSSLGKISIYNLDHKNSLLYIHTFLAFIMFPFCILVMRHYSKSLNFRNVSLEITKTLQIENIPKHLCSERVIKNHFSEAYPDLQVVDVCIAYDVSDLTYLMTFLRDAVEARDYSREYYNNNPGKTLEMKASCCSKMCSCCCCGMPYVDVKDWYTDEVERLKQEAAQQTEISLHSPLGMAFVTFKSLNSSKKVYDDFQTSIYKLWIKHPTLSSLSTSLRPEKWRVNFAPEPSDIYWHSLQDNRVFLNIKSILADLVLVIIVIFFTTPVAVATDLIKILFYVNEKTFQLPDYITNISQTLMLSIAFFLLPYIIIQSVRCMGEWYRSRENYLVMVKIFWFLWFCFILAPLIGVQTLVPTIEYLFKPNVSSSTPANETFGIKWGCISMVDYGAMFVNFAVSQAFLGTALELVRVPEFLQYVFYLSMARTVANFPSIKRGIASEFRFGENYARMLVIFTLTMLLSLVQPLISPISLIYFVLKYLCDKHNLAGVYYPSEIDETLHRSAINIVVFAATFQQIYLTVLAFTRREPDEPWFPPPARFVVLCVILALELLIFFAQAFSGFCHKISPIKHVDPIYQEDEQTPPEGQYIPGVLIKEIKDRRRKEQGDEEGRGEEGGDDIDDDNEPHSKSDNNIPLTIIN